MRVLPQHLAVEYEDFRGFVPIPVANLVAGQRTIKQMTMDDLLSAELHAAPGQPLDLIYDTRFTRPSYDFINYLGNADVYAQAHGFSRIRMRFDGEENDFLRNVCRPALALLPNCTEGHDSDEPTQAIAHVMRFMVEVYRRTGLTPRMKGRIQHCPGDFATVTLRECVYQKNRNSNVEAWIEFARTLPGRVIVIRDTAKADEPLDGFETSPLASRNLHYRMSLYERARMNYFVSNGPVGLVQFTQHIPYLCINKSPPEHSFHQPLSVAQYFGIERGEQWPWATERQRLVWSEDSLPEIMAAAALVQARSAA